MRSESLKKRTEKDRKESKPKSNEDYSHKEWEEIMGKNRSTYKRGRGGAIRRK